MGEQTRKSVRTVASLPVLTARIYYLLVTCTLARRQLAADDAAHSPRII